MPVDKNEAVYVEPPALLEQFHLVPAGTYWGIGEGSVRVKG